MGHTCTHPSNSNTAYPEEGRGVIAAAFPSWLWAKCGDNHWTGLQSLTGKHTHKHTHPHSHRHWVGTDPTLPANKWGEGTTTQSTTQFSNKMNKSKRIKVGLHTVKCSEIIGYFALVFLPNWNMIRETRLNFELKNAHTQMYLFIYIKKASYLIITYSMT